MRKIMCTAFIGMLVISCGSSMPAGNELNVDRDGTKFMGQAGSQWTEEEIRNSNHAAICGVGGKVETVQFSKQSEGYLKFSGNCSYS